MSNQEIEIFARELIRLFVASLRDLNDGKAVPKGWREALNGELGPVAKRGLKPDPAVTEREQGWAREMLSRRLAVKRGERTGQITAFAECLADKASTAKHTFTPQDIFKAERKWYYLVRSEEARRALAADDHKREADRRARKTELQRRRDCGESLDDILRDPDLPIETFAAIRVYQNDQSRPLFGVEAPSRVQTYESRAKAIQRWVYSAWRLGVGWAPPPVLNFFEASEKGLIADGYQPRNPSSDRHRRQR